MLVRGWRIEMARALAEPAAAVAAAHQLRAVTADVSFNCVVGIERGGTVLVHALAGAESERGVAIDIATCALRESLVLRSQTAGRWVPRAGSRVLLVDDVVNSGLTVRRGIRAIEATGADVVAVACLVRYPKSAPLLLRTWRGQLLSAFTLEDLLLRRFGVLHSGDAGSNLS